MYQLAGKQFGVVAAKPDLKPSRAGEMENTCVWPWLPTRWAIIICHRALRVICEEPVESGWKAFKILHSGHSSNHIHKHTHTHTHLVPPIQAHTLIPAQRRLLFLYCGNQWESSITQFNAHTFPLKPALTHSHTHTHTSRWYLMADRFACDCT